MISRLSDERGAIAGFEALPFGFLVFVVGSLILFNAWAVVDGKLAAAAAAREAARAYVESSGPGGVAEAGARRAAEEALSGQARDPERLTLTSEGPLVFERCAPATFVATYSVATISLPWVGSFGGGLVDMTAKHREVVDPYRDGVPFEAGSDTVSCDA